MMVSGQITHSKERVARNKALFLIKKWTSLSFLNESINAYRRFIDEYQRSLDYPSVNQADLESYYIESFLPWMVDFERGLEILRQGVDKREAYSTLLSAYKFWGYLWGLPADYLIIEHDPFFMRMGRGGRRERADGVFYTEADSGVVQECAHLRNRLRVLSCTVNLDFEGALEFGKRPDGGVRIFTHWNYESMFGGARGGLGPWPPDSDVPETAAECPPRNESGTMQVFNGDNVSVDGIYEPWLPNGAVGCPNYLMKGSVAHQYRMEKSDELLQTRWRILWEDRRYLGGNLTAEETSYVGPITPEPYLKFGAYAGDICPKTGRWQAFRLNNRVEFVQRGNHMPGPDRTSTGLVHWHFLD